ncbi:MAG: hypothetical protein RR008_03795, partial [Clostridia bacterium]
MKFLTNLKSHSFFNCILKSGLLAVIFLSTFCLSACSKPANCLKKDISTEILTGDTTLPEDNKKDDKHISASPYAQDLIVPSHIDIDINETQCKITAVVLPKNCTSIVKFAIVNGQNVIEIIENKII